jgi:hypothetical protein
MMEDLQSESSMEIPPDALSTDTAPQSTTDGAEDNAQTLNEPIQSPLVSSASDTGGVVHEFATLQPSSPVENEDVGSSAREDGQAPDTTTCPPSSLTRPESVQSSEEEYGMSTFIRDRISNIKEMDFWQGISTEPYAAPPVGYATVLGKSVSSGTARMDVRLLRVFKNSMEFTLARIKEFDLENLPKQDSCLKTLLLEEPSEAQLREIEVRQAISQRHISMAEDRTIWDYELDGADSICAGSKKIRNFLAHQYGVTVKEHSETTLFAELADIYRSQLRKIDILLPALEEALYDANRWSSTEPDRAPTPQVNERNSWEERVEVATDTADIVEQTATSITPSMELLETRPGKVISFIRTLFGLRISKLEDLEAEADNCSGPPPEPVRHGWIWKAYKYLYYRSSWIRGVGDHLEDGLNAVHNGWWYDQQEE